MGSWNGTCMISNLPPRHKAHTNPDLVIERSIIKEVTLPIFNKIENKVGVVFFNEEPVLKELTT